MTLRLSALLLSLALLPAAARAEFLDLPFPVLSSHAEPPVYDSYDLPLAGWNKGELPTRRYEGVVDRRVWRLEAPGRSLMDVLAPLRDQLIAMGFERIFDCTTRQCGGFDFRFATEILPEPAMYVDLGDFRFASFVREGEAASLTVSRSLDTVFVQLIHVGENPLLVMTPVIAPDAGADRPPAEARPLPVATTPTDLPARLEAGLPVTLEDLDFGSGRAQIVDQDYASLRQLADWLRADERRTITLVGHTDASGAMAANVTLSQRRAESVLQLLVRRHGIASRRLDARGVGPLAPRASNGDEEGRARNRRVEAVPDLPR